MLDNAFFTIPYILSSTVNKGGPELPCITGITIIIIIIIIVIIMILLIILQ